MKRILSATGVLLMLASPTVVAIACGQDKIEYSDVIKTIGVQDVFSYIKSDENQLPSNVDKPKPFNLRIKDDNGSHIVKATVTNWTANNAEGKINYTLELVHGDNRKEIKGVLTNYLTQKMFDVKTLIEGFKLGDVYGLPTSNPKEIPSNVPMPNLEYKKDKDVKITVVEWDQQDSMGLVSYELEVTKNGYSKRLFGDIAYKSQGQHNEHFDELDSVTHISFENFPQSSSIMTTDAFQELDKDELKLRSSAGNIELTNVTWTKDKEKGEVSWELEISHNDIHTGGTRKISGVISGFMTKAQEDAKALIDGMTLNQLKLTGLPVADSSKLPSEISVPTISTNQKGINATLKLWDPHDSNGVIQYQVEIEKMGFKKIFTERIPGFQTSQGRDDLALLDMVHPESLFNFPIPDSNLYPTEVIQPTLTAPMEGMNATVTEWTPNDYAGTIEWKIKLELNGQVKKIEGTIEGYAHMGWFSFGVYEPIPEGTKLIHGIWDVVIDGNLNVPNSVEKIDYGFLSGSTINGRVTIPNNFSETQWSLFRGITWAQEIDLSTNDKLTYINNQSFSSSHIGKLTLPTSVEIIGRNSFYDTQVNNFTLENMRNLKEIKSGAFRWTKFKKGFALPEHKIKLGYLSFYQVELPNGFKIPTSYDATQVAHAFDHMPVNGIWKVNGQEVFVPVPGAVFQKI